MRRETNHQPLSEINITPLTDVMLVLLIIFMISSPVLLARGININLPKVSDPPMLEKEDHVLYLEADGKISLDGKEIVIDQLKDAFSNLVAEADLERKSVNLFIKADENVTYGAITKLMDLATISGIEQIGLVQEVLEPESTEIVNNNDELTGPLQENHAVNE